MMRAQPWGGHVALLTGGEDPHYALGLARALVAQGMRLDIIGSDETARPEFLADPAISVPESAG